MSYVTSEEEVPWSKTKTAAALAIGITLLTGAVLIVLSFTASRQEAVAGKQRAQACQVFCQDVGAEGIYRTDCGRSSTAFDDCEYGHCTCVPDTLIKKLRVSGQTDFGYVGKPEGAKVSPETKKFPPIGETRPGAVIYVQP